MPRLESVPHGSRSLSRLRLIGFQKVLRSSQTDCRLPQSDCCGRRKVLTGIRSVAFGSPVWHTGKARALWLRVFDTSGGGEPLVLVSFLSDGWLHKMSGKLSLALLFGRKSAKVAKVSFTLNLAVACVCYRSAKGTTLILVSVSSHQLLRQQSGDHHEFAASFPYVTLYFCLVVRGKQWLLRSNPRKSPPLVLEQR